LSAAIPWTTGASAAGSCGSAVFAQCCSPFTSNLWISVWKAACTCAAVPENSMATLPFDTFATWNPRAPSHAVTAAMSVSAGPNRRPNSSGVSHLWNPGEPALYRSLIARFSAACCSGLRFSTSSIRGISKLGGAIPRSNSGRASGWTLPWKRTSCCSLIACVMRAGTIACVMRAGTIACGALAAAALACALLLAAPTPNTPRMNSATTKVRTATANFVVFIVPPTLQIGLCFRKSLLALPIYQTHPATARTPASETSGKASIATSRGLNGMLRLAPFHAAKPEGPPDFAPSLTHPILVLLTTLLRSSC